MLFMYFRIIITAQKQKGHKFAISLNPPHESWVNVKQKPLHLFFVLLSRDQGSFRVFLSSSHPHQLACSPQIPLKNRCLGHWHTSLPEMFMGPIRNYTFVELYDSARAEIRHLFQNSTKRLTFCPSVKKISVGYPCTPCALHTSLCTVQST